MCHMLADTVDELHAMADRIGVERRWFQGRKTPHYDVCLSKRAQAVRLGAVEVGRREVVELVKKFRRQGYLVYYEQATKPRGGQGRAAHAPRRRASA